MPKILNVILCVILIFLLTFCWIYYSLKSVNLALGLASIVAIATGYILWQANTKWEKNKQIKQKHKNDVNSLREYLEFNGDNGELLADMLTYYDFEIINRGFDSLTVCKNGVNCYVATDFTRDTASRDFIRNSVLTAKRNGRQKLYIFCNKCDNPLQKLANEHVPTIFVDINNLYALLEQSGKLPELAQKKQKKASFIASYAFNKKRFGWYFLSSLFSLAVSFISYMKYYLLGWATAFFIIAIYCLLNKRYNHTPTSVTLD